MPGVLGMGIHFFHVSDRSADTALVDHLDHLLYLAGYLPLIMRCCVDVVKDPYHTGPTRQTCGQEPSQQTLSTVNQI